VSLNSRTKGKGEKEPKGLDPNQRSELMRVIDPQCKHNPWDDPFVKLRNQIIVTLMLGPGPRRGETLSAKGNALQAASRLLAIIRNQDDKTDPRRKQPLPKTKERLLLLGPDLLALLIQYMKERGKKPVARKHGFLFVSRSGKPLSTSSITKMFADLRKACPGIGYVTAHVLRHTSNELFSDHADAISMDPVTEKRLRIEKYGWSPRTRMADYYLRRKTKHQAGEASLAVQNQITREANDAKLRIQEENELRRFLSGDML